MSRPYQFSQDHRSPLDRRPQGPPSGQPPSFSTNVNRAKTKKWVEAKAYSYDGDDWGEYDETDEYGASAAPPMPPPAHNIGPGRSFTDPRAGGAQQPLDRKNSFNTGDERRAFSGPQHPGQPHPLDTRGATIQSMRAEGNIAQSPNTMNPGQGPTPRIYQPYSPSAAQQGPPPMEPASRQSSTTSWAQSDLSETPSANGTPHQRHDFNSSALPQPLHPQAPAVTADTPRAGFVSRKSTPGQEEAAKLTSSSTQADPALSRDGASSQSSAMPNIIRPADIYKRIAEAREKERASSESSRPSIDSLGSRPQGNETTTRNAAPLASLPERQSELRTDPVVPQGPPTIQTPAGMGSAPTVGAIPQRYSNSPELPQFSTGSNFGDEFWSQTGFDKRQSTQMAPTQNPPSVDTGLRGVVDQAFTRKDDNSVPPTPVTGQTVSTSEDGSGVSRSNTDSTTGISPIMSRVPSSAAAAARARTAEEQNMATPAIAEESPNASRRASTNPQGVEPMPRRPDQASHSRTASGNSNPQRRSLASPTPTQSPARSPVIASATFAEPSAAEIDVASSISPSTTLHKMSSPPQDFTVREADLANAASNSPETEIAKLAEKEKECQSAFLEQPKDFRTLPSNQSTPRNRSESPTKSRVLDLAGRFGDVDSRRNSMQSVGSRKSVAFKEENEEISPDASRPTATREESFRPKLPGQWESYVTTPGVSSPTEEDKGLQSSPNVQQTDEEVDLNPTTTRQSASMKPVGSTAADAMAVLAAAGAAMGESIKAAAGLGDDKSDPNDESQSRSVGGITTRPLAADRLEPNYTTSKVAAPTPPPKDDDDWPSTASSSPQLGAVAPLRSREGTPLSGDASRLSTVDRPPAFTQLSSGPAPGDQESDRLRKEIVQTLSPITAESPEASKLAEQLSPPAKVTSRDSSVLPAEYDTFSYPFRDLGCSQDRQQPAELPAQPPVQDVPDIQAAGGTGQLDRRFSWEKPKQQNAEPSASATLFDTAPVAASSPTAPAPPQKDLEPLGPAVNRGLHVLNTETPEAVETPMFGLAPAAPVPIDEPHTGHHEPVSPISSLAQTPVPALAALAATPSDTSRIPPFREILALKSAHERTQKYDSTRRQFADMDTGLRNWLSVTLTQRPEHADVRDLATRPIAVSNAAAGSNRHRHAPSLNVFNKINQPSSSNNSPSSPAVATGSPGGFGQAERVPSVSGGPAGGKMQARGKEFLQSATLLGGKGAKGAKGLFAKSKSRFKGSGGDKGE